MLKMKGQNSSAVRYHNQKLALDLFIQKPYCCEEMAKSLSLTSPGTKKIIDEMYNYNIIVIDNSDVKKTVGRAPIYYKLNRGFGVIVIIDLTHHVWMISDLNISILYKEVIELKSQNDIYSIDDFLKLSSNITKKLHKDFSNDCLLSIGIATYGKVDNETGEFIKVGRIRDYKNINLKNLYGQIFNVPIIINNDVYFSAEAELSYGRLRNCEENSLFVCFGNGIASILIINGKIVGGVNGLAGEIGFNKVYSPLLKMTGYLQDFITTGYIVENVFRFCGVAYRDFVSLAKDYSSGSNIFDVVIDDVVHLLSNTLINYTNLLDNYITVISGEITLLGERFFNKINKYIEDNYYRKIVVAPSTIITDIVIKGCGKAVTEKTLLNILNKNKK